MIINSDIGLEVDEALHNFQPDSLCARTTRTTGHTIMLIMATPNFLELTGVGGWSTESFVVKVGA